MDLERQYSTAGFTGLYEALNILGMDGEDDEGIEFAQDILDTINDVNAEMSEVFKAPHNMEQVPAESSAVKLARKDAIMGIHETEDGEDYDLYSNQFLPLWLENVDILDRIRVQGALDPACTGGAVCHLNIGNKIKDTKVMEAIIKHSCASGVVYIAVNYMLGQCTEHHVTAASGDICPICGSPIVSRYTRVVGFLTDTAHWGKTRREVDLPNRRFVSC